ncbi:type II toxin-antitoxin system ParD family antitoxin [Occallatibacter riparius]|uniref:Type II toxin-antitoxin system ParD family antitoxin n=1 Tax=Occallatibacter riparius TaxID=1002689 RepID=A0A9J7BMB6_9BACT|nr:type II toxin-antitoxin system ParD family antitoxin [Occallatibacter riparius]UWZ83819.1 type II toxin-antitoxin system ParD family antitoxin [Occallatibacter riparius]
MTNSVIESSMFLEEIFPMNVSLTPELEKFVADKVATGRYTSASEVVREALRLLEREEKSREEHIADFDRELDARVAALDRGERVSKEEFLREMEQLLGRRKKRIA